MKGKIPDDKKQQLLQDDDPKEALSQILTEENFLLTGATAFLGFQFSIVFNQNFSNLSDLVQYTHFISLYLIGIAVILLFVPIAYHRIGVQGRHTENQPVFAHYIFKTAMAVFSLGVTFEIFAACSIVFQNTVIAAVMAIVTLLLYAFFWLILPMYGRRVIDK
jgi:hypothetical protein